MVQVGEVAPDFTLPDQHAQRVSLSAGIGPTLIVFFPAAFTPVCTGELHDLGAVSSQVRVLAVSCDSMYTLRALGDTEGIGFALLSDFWPHGEVARAYDAFDDMSGTARRVSVLVDERGVAADRWQSPGGQARDASAYLQAVAALGAG